MSDPYGTLHPFAEAADAGAMISFSNLVEAKQKRIELTRLLWGTDRLPTETALYYAGSPDNRWTNLKQIDRMDYTLSHGFAGSCSAFIPINSNRRGILYQEGHNPSFWSGEKYIKYFVAKGYIVIAFSMPTLDPNNRPVVTTPYGNIKMLDHSAFALLPAPPSPLTIFIEPIIRVLNSIPVASYYRDITMLGYSGGGWTTTLCAALDERIKFSFPVAGSLPSWIRYLPPNGENAPGDLEQFIPQFYQHVDWTELYALGTTNGRQQMQILNQFDPCCFAGINYRSYEKAVSEVASLWGGQFSVWLDTENREHSISDAALAAIDTKLN